MRKPTLTASALLLLLLSGSVLHAEVLNRIVLRVNDRIATLHDYERRRDEVRREIARRETDPEERRRLLEGAGEMVFKEMYEEMLLQSRADQLGVEVTNAQVDAAVAQMRQGFGIANDEQFQGALAQSGMTEVQLREQLRRNIRAREVIGREIQGRIKLDEEDLRRYYGQNLDQFRVPEQVHLREVVVLEEGGASAEERAATARAIRAAIAAGKTMEEVVKPYQEKGATSGAIDLGWVSPGDLDPGLETAAWGLQAGALSEPVDGRGGTHVLQMIERHEARVRPFNEVSAEIQAREQDRVYREQFALYEQELQNESLIVAKPPQEAEGFRRLIGAPPEDPLHAAGRPAAAAPPAAGSADPAAEAAVPSVAPPDETPGGLLQEPKPVNTSPPAALPEAPLPDAPPAEEPAAEPEEPPGR